MHIRAKKKTLAQRICLQSSGRKVLKGIDLVKATFLCCTENSQKHLSQIEEVWHNQNSSKSWLPGQTKQLRETDPMTTTTELQRSSVQTGHSSSKKVNQFGLSSKRYVQRDPGTVYHLPITIPVKQLQELGVWSD